MAGPGETLGSPWISFPVRACDPVIPHLQGAVHILVAFFKSMKVTFTEVELENFDRLCLLFLDTIVSNVGKCVKCLFPSQRQARTVWSIQKGG
jgi:hypothetical protein